MCQCHINKKATQYLQCMKLDYSTSSDLVLARTDRQCTRAVCQVSDKQNSKSETTIFDDDKRVKTPKTAGADGLTDDRRMTTVG